MEIILTQLNDHYFIIYHNSLLAVMFFHTYST